MSDHPPVYFGMMNVEDNDFATEHFCLCGSSGCGKTTFIKLMMQSVLHKMSSETDTRAFVYDFKGELYPFFCALLGRFCPDVPLHLINPFDQRSTWWDIAQDVTSSTDAQQVAAILVPERASESNPFFTDATRNILANLILSFHRHSPGEWNFRDIICALSSPIEYRRVLARDPDTGFAAQRTGDDRTQANIDSTVNNTFYQFQTVASLMDAAKRRGQPPLSIRRWVTEPGIVLATFDPTAEAVLEPYYRAFLYSLKQHLLSLPNNKNRRSWIFLDEFHTLKPVPGFDTFVTNARSKGACVVLGFQNIESLRDEKRYGRNASTIVGECKNKLFFKASSFEHAEWCAKEYGQAEFYKESEERSESYQYGMEEGWVRGHHRSDNRYSYTQTASFKVDFEYTFLRNPGEFLAIPLVHQTGDFQAYSIIRGERIPRSLAFREAVYPTLASPPDIPELDRAPDSDQNLALWEYWDYHRLNIKVSDEPDRSAFREIMKIQRPL